MGCILSVSAICAVVSLRMRVCCRAKRVDLVERGRIAIVRESIWIDDTGAISVYAASIYILSQGETFLSSLLCLPPPQYIVVRR